MRISVWSSDVCSSDLEGGVERWDCLVYRELEVEGRGEGEKLEQQRQAKRLDERALEPDEIEPELRQAGPRALIDAGERAGGREFERDAGPVSRHFRGAERDDSARRIVDDVARAGKRALHCREHEDMGDRKSVELGKSISVRVDPGGRRLIIKINCFLNLHIRFLNVI